MGCQALRWAVAGVASRFLSPGVPRYALPGPPLLRMSDCVRPRNKTALRNCLFRKALSSAPCRTRTYNPLIKSHKVHMNPLIDGCC